MNNTNEMYHVCARKTMEEISTIINKINKIVQTRGYITKNTFLSDCLGEVPFNDKYSHVGWTIGACEHAVLTVGENRYDLYLPLPDWFDNENENESEKEKYEMHREYVGKFKHHADALKVLSQAIEVAMDYGYITMTDINWLIGTSDNYNDSKRGWTYDAIIKGNVRRNGNTFVISLPRCNWFDDATMIKPSDEKSTVKSEQPQPEPINITIPANKPEVIRETINALCGNLEKIKDRPVFINIM